MLPLRYEHRIETRWGLRDVCPSVSVFIFFIVFPVYTNYLTDGRFQTFAVV